MSLSTAVIIATKGRPTELSALLALLKSQTVPADMVIVSACGPDDVADSTDLPMNVNILFGSPGLPAQRNRALSLVRDKYDIVVFFDDDFVPSLFWIENIRRLLATHPDIVCVTGKVLKDGVKAGGIEWVDGQTIVNEMDVAGNRSDLAEYEIRGDRSAYGCNMAFRVKAVENIVFDERLPLYGWLEDRDFSFRAAANGRAVWSDALWGVHLGSRGVRISGLRFGYSQVVNPWYLMTKGTMTPAHVCRNILQAFAANIARSILPDPYIDRPGRLKGNITGISDIVRGRWKPERIAEL